MIRTAFLVVLQGADAGRVVVGEVVPHPAGPERLLLESRCRRPTNTPADRADAALLQPLGPSRRTTRSAMPSAATRLGSPEPTTTRSPLRTPSLTDPAPRPWFRRCSPSPASPRPPPASRSSCRGGQHQLAGVQRIERLVGLQRLDQHAPVAAREAAAAPTPYRCRCASVARRERRLDGREGRDRQDERRLRGNEQEPQRCRADLRVPPPHGFGDRSPKRAARRRRPGGHTGPPLFRDLIQRLHSRR